MSTKKASAVLNSQTPPDHSPETNGAGQPRYFEYVGGSSSKFWEVSQFGCEMTTRWGRIGSAGQSQVKSFADEAAAAKAVERLIGEKTAKGYVER